ncbi:MAG: hypothetical protein P8013_05515 [Candidatus Sulfobium sp.]|jgi:response regulator RpfG family c-di-GMP phosphodiesterase
MKLDLSGYPPAAEGRKLNLFSRIVSIADDYDSMVLGRVYGRSRIRREDALELLVQKSGTLYDPPLVRAFVDVFIRKILFAHRRVQSRARLSRCTASSEYL